MKPPHPAIRIMGRSRAAVEYVRRRHDEQRLIESPDTVEIIVTMAGLSSASDPDAARPRSGRHRPLA